MSALPLETSDAIEPVQPAPRGVQWIDLAEAARRSGWSDGHIRRWCPGWERRGLARKQRPQGRGKPEWYVREDASPRFARVQSADARPFDDRHLTDPQRAALNGRLAIVQRWEQALRAGLTLGFNRDRVTEHFLLELQAEGRALSRATLYNWLAAYERDGKAGLVDGRSRADEKRLLTPTGAMRVDPDSGEVIGGRHDDPFLNFVRNMWLTTARARLTSCHEAACYQAKLNGWGVRSYKSCQRMIDAIPEPVKIKFREGGKAYTDKAEPFVERDYASLKSNEIWCGDHHRFDVIVAHEGQLVRPWLTAWQDVRSRKIVGWLIFAHDPNQDTIVLAFRNAVRAHGVPERVYVDNGKDYDAEALQGETKVQRRRRRGLKVEYDPTTMGGIFGGLGVRTTHCVIYHGQSKPIERWFREACQRFSKTFATYCGRNTDEKPDTLKDALKRGEAPTLAEFTDAFAAWLPTEHARPHTGDGMDGRTPDQVHAACLDHVVTAPEALLDLLLMKASKPVKVGQNGVAWQGINYGQFEPELHSRLGQLVQLRYDPADLSRVVVFDRAGRFVCAASANRRMPFAAGQQDLRAAMQLKRRARRVVNEARATGMRIVQDPTDVMIQAAVERNRAAATDRPADAPLPPAPARAVRTPFDDQLPAIQRAVGRGPAAERHAEELASLDALRPTALKLAGGASEGGTEDADDEVFDSISDAMRRVRREATA